MADLVLLRGLGDGELKPVSPRLQRSQDRRARMRYYTYSLLINALRSDGTYASLIQVQTCKAFRVLPWDVGFAHASRVTVEPPGQTVGEATWEHVLRPIGEWVMSKAAELGDGFTDLAALADHNRAHALTPYDLSDLDPWRVMPEPWPISADFTPPRVPKQVEVTYVGRAFPKLGLEVTDALGITPLDTDDPAEVEAALEAANRLIDDHQTPKLSTDDEPNPNGATS
jgi:hypothetical protein